MKKFIPLIAITLMALSCKKNQLDGKSLIKGTVVHHSTSIPNARVFIKFNAKEFPGSDTSKYDHKLNADLSGKFELKVYKGDYYIYAVGVDYASANPDVKGGVPVRVRHKETVDVLVPVTDQH